MIGRSPKYEASVSQQQDAPEIIVVITPQNIQIPVL